jgi:formylglycine-generating enzyme required for sulfatase activity
MHVHRFAPSRHVAVVVGLLLIAGCGSPGTDATPTAPPTVTPSVTPGIAATAAPSVVVSSAPTLAPTPVPSDGQTAGETRTDASGVEQVWVPAGSFQMGTDDAAIAALTKAAPPAWVTTEFPSEQPAHKVTLTAGYWIDKYEVTNEAFARFVDAGGYGNKAYWSDAGWDWLGGEDASRLPLGCGADVPKHPRMCVNWYEAEAYANWRGGRLPTEAEWEYAARGPASAVYPWGDDFTNDRANVVDSLGPKPVGSYPTGVSWVGAHDMAGNAMEWVADWLGVSYYGSSPEKDPAGPTTGSKKVEKGGWWGSNPFVARSAYRHYEDAPWYGDKHIGLRIASQ